MFGTDPDCKNGVGDRFAEIAALFEAGAADLVFNCAIVVHTMLHCVDTGVAFESGRMDRFPAAHRIHWIH